jgi:hypothetical protein
MSRLFKMNNLDPERISGLNLVQITRVGELLPLVMGVIFHLPSKNKRGN